MGVVDSSYIKALGVKSPGLKTILLIFSDTLVHTPLSIEIAIYKHRRCSSSRNSLRGMIRPIHWYRRESNTYAPSWFLHTGHIILNNSRQG